MCRPVVAGSVWALTLAAAPIVACSPDAGLGNESLGATAGAMNASPSMAGVSGQSGGAAVGMSMGSGGSGTGGLGTGGAAGTPALGSAGTIDVGGAPAGGAASAGEEAGGAAGAETGGAGVGGAALGPGGDEVVQALTDYLAIARDERPPLEAQPFATLPLGAVQASLARELIWNDHVALIQETRQVETDARAIVLDDVTLLYDFTTFGDAPSDGRSLFLSLHGGGEADPSVNDEQWENQKGLYQPEEGIYLSPRAPTNTWNLWHEAHIDPLFERLIENLIVFEGVNPNRVYVMGYSAGGDGVYQLGPRMADHWAAASMMAGHPNEAKPDSLRNIGFTIHVGGLDTGFDRNLVAAEWGALLDGLEAQDPEGYPHYVEIHPDKPHWMDLEDAVAVPWMAGFTRNPTPERVVWLQDDITHDRFYWLAVEPDDAVVDARVVAEYAGQNVTLEADGVSRLKLRFSDAMLNLDEEVHVSAGGTALFDGVIERTVLSLWTTTVERGDPELVFPAEVSVEIP